MGNLPQELSQLYSLIPPPLLSSPPLHRSVSLSSTASRLKQTAAVSQHCEAQSLVCVSSVPFSNILE